MPTPLNDRVFQVMLALLLVAVGTVGWLLQTNVVELDSRIDAMRDRVLQGCGK
jgi:hypothetical protein